MFLASLFIPKIQINYHIHRQKNQTPKQSNPKNPPHKIILLHPPKQYIHISHLHINHNIPTSKNNLPQNDSKQK
jgi:hypothetical protein